MRLLLHVCCAPCLTVVLEGYRELGYDVTGLFYNPNIHPWKERQRRLDSLRSYASEVEMALLVDEAYPLEENLRMLLAAPNRCAACFAHRLDETARRAAEGGFERFATTLTVSPYQRPDLILEAGTAAAAGHGVDFSFRDYRPAFRTSVEMSRALGLYRQPYCGCVMSERDRYLGIASPGQGEERFYEAGEPGPERIIGG
ncbi:MAG: epoxyqueuosine reductase QueH [Candidatus Fermentibacterota bacterium]